MAAHILMPSTPPADFLAIWRQFLDRPIASTLLLSLSLHLALLALIQPAPGGGGGEPLLIQARLAMPAAPEAEPEPVAEAPPEPAEAVAPPLQPPPELAQPLLTSPVPSPAPPLPVAPTPLEAPPQVTPPALPVKEAPREVAREPAGVVPAAAAAPSASGAPIGIGIDTTWYLARQVDKAAHAADSIVPDYPPEARRRNQEGSLKLMLRIDDLGRVRDVEVIEADPPGVFDAAALEAFQAARFHPAMKDGRPVRYQAYIRVLFKLRD